MAKKNILTNNSVSRFVKEAVTELKRVVWPKKSYVIKMTILVVISIILAAILIGAFDYGMAKVLKVLIEIK